MDTEWGGVKIRKYTGQEEAKIKGEETNDESGEQLSANSI